MEPLGDEMILYLQSGAHQFIGKVDSHHKVKVNDEIQVVVNLDKIHLFEPGSGKNVSLEEKALVGAGA